MNFWYIYKIIVKCLHTQPQNLYSPLVTKWYISYLSIHAINFGGGGPLFPSSKWHNQQRGQLGPIYIYGDVYIYGDIYIYGDLKFVKSTPMEILKNKNLWKLFWQGNRRLIECAQWPQARQLSKLNAGGFQFIIITNHVVAPANLVKAVTSPYMEIWYFSRHQMSRRDSIIVMLD